MSPPEVETAARAAGHHLLGSPTRLSLDVVSDRQALSVARAIYLAFGRDGELHYIGKVNRERGDVRARINEHMRTSRRKRVAWRTVWIVPLMPSISATELTTLERSLIRAYRPIGNVQHSENLRRTSLEDNRLARPA